MKFPGARDAFSKGLAFIASTQRPDGSFNSFSSPAIEPFETKITYRTTFTPTLILSALSAINEQPAQDIRQKLATWLLSQKSPAWSYNYWATDAPERTTMPYPDDLDDTFCALIALRKHNPDLINEACLGTVVKLLIATESQVGGPYRTWLVAKEAPSVWKDIDLAVNCNVACLLKMVADPLPNLTALMDQAVTSRNFRSPYYPSIYPVAYYLARAYSSSHANELVNYLFGHQIGGWWGTPLQTALAVSALANLGQAEKCATPLQRLLDSQLPDGSWPAEAFCIDPSLEGKKHYNGSPALTTALALEALALCTSSAEQSVAHDATTEQLSAQIAGTAEQEIKKLKTDLKNQGLRMLADVKSRDKNHEIVLLPRFFNNSMAKPLDPSSAKSMDHLGLGNLYGWAAYTIYDDIIDGDTGPRLLPAANTALRYSHKHFWEALPTDKAFHKLVEQTFNGIDGANAWELEHCRMEVTDTAITISKLPRYTKTLNLADRSLGHTLTPLGVLAAAGVEPDDRRAILVRRALRHYLVARQLNDDLHDWEQDFRTGLISYVVAKVLEELSITPGTYAFDDLIPKMQRQFWHHTLVEVCKTITKHTALARRTAQSSHLLIQPNIITDLVDKIDGSVEHTLSEQNKAEQFLAAYRSES